MLFYPFNTHAYRTYLPTLFFLSSHFFASLLILVVACGAGVSFAEASPTISAPQTTNISMWNGNKTDSRQEYEREVLAAALAATNKTHGPWNLTIDKTDYSAAEDEASVFRTKGFDIFGTVAGNQKLANEQKILIPLPLMKGLLGYRILIVRSKDREKFAAIKTAKQLQKLRLGIPSTWADAELFRQNGYQVVEKGSFDELFTRLRNKEFDYVSFGANEVAGVFAERALPVGQLVIEQSLLVYYPFPLVFYVNPKNKALAERVTQGLTRISANGELDKIFTRHFGKELVNLNLNERQKVQLSNPMLPPEMMDFKPGL